MSDGSVRGPDGVSPGAYPWVTVSSLVRALHRRWRLWCVAACCGLLTGILLSLAFPPAHSASTTILLRHLRQSDPSGAMATDANLAKTRTVARAALRRLGSDLPIDKFISSYRATPITDDLLQVTATASSGPEAVRRANSVAESFLEFRREELRRELQVALQTLRQRTDELTRELASLNEAINAISSSSSQGPNNPEVRRLGELLTNRGSIQEELGSLRRQVDDIRQETNAAVEKSRVVDRASRDDRSLLRAALPNGAAGLVAGLGLGVGWVILQEVVSDRVRRREDIAAALEIPVGVSVGSFRGPIRVQRWRLRRQQDAPGGDLWRIVQHLRDCLSHQDASSPALIVLSVESDRPAALATAALAIDLSNEGRRVLVADLSPRAPLASLFQVPVTKTSTVYMGSASTLWITFPTTASRPEDRQTALDHDFSRKIDVVLVLASINPADGAWHLKEWASAAAPVVTAGRSTANALRSTSHMLRVAGLELAPAILVGADRTDDSLGTTDPARSTPTPRFPAARKP